MINQQLLNKIREYILTTNKSIVTKEDMAIQFKVKEHEVERCFQQLNIEGLLSQAQHAIDTQWKPDIYRIRNNKKQDIFKGRLLLTNINGTKKLGNHVIKIFVARQPLNNMDKLGWKWASRLAPAYKLVQAFKKHGINWNAYYQRYMKEVIYNPESKIALDIIYNHLKSGEDIALICYCTNAQQCHRSILGKYYEEFGASVYDIDNLYVSERWALGMEGIFNETYINQLLDESLTEDKMIQFIWHIKGYIENGVKMQFTNTHFTKIIDAIFKSQNSENNKQHYMELADIIKQHYTLPVDLQDKLESVIIINKLNN